VGEPIVAIKHRYTHFKITLHAFACRLIAGQPQALGVAGWRWATFEELDAFAFPRTDRKIIAALHSHNYDSKPVISSDSEKSR
jgi:A/G-specific adenine glycosylase